MPRYSNEESGIARFVSFSSASSSGTKGTELELDMPLSHWSLEVITTSTAGATVTLKSAVSSSGIGTTVLSVTGSTDGVMGSTTFAAARVWASLDTLSSSGSVGAFICGAP